MPDLLLEILSEEIPARMQRKAAGDLRKLVTDALVDAGLHYDGAREYWTPRRLVLDLRGLSARSADIKDERKGPRTDAPEKAIEGFLRGAGLTSKEDAEVHNDPKKGDYYVAVINKPGRDAVDIIADVMPNILQNFPWPKSMRWGASSAEPGSLKWVRPLQSILCLFGPETEEPEVVKFEIGGITSGNETRGHRFHEPKPFTVRRFDDYVTALEKAHVMLDAERRKESIKTDAKNLAFARGLELVEDDGLLEEVGNLVEWPVALIGEFEPVFLELPQEVIQLTIKENQKCFVLRKGKSLSNNFLMVANIEASDGGKEIALGNAKVVNARLADAKFFWESDLQQIASEEGFEPWLGKLAGVTFHKRLGSQGERVQRIIALAGELAPPVGADIEKTQRAAFICKADLNSAMVYEFPELQGQMGRKYALAAGEDEAVARACEDHHKPQGPSDDVPSDPVSIAVALADKLDTLVGFWAIDEKPTGSKDPYALRRAALGVVRLILENGVRLKLLRLFNYWESTLQPENIESATAQSMTDMRSARDLNLLSFFHDRLKVYLRDSGARHDLIDAVITSQSDDLLMITRRVEALSSFLDTDDGKNLLAGTKRAANILAAEEKKKTAVAESVDPNLFETDEERALFDSLEEAEKFANQAIEKEDFARAMGFLSQLRAPLDMFFEHVMVNAEDEKIRSNRLALMRRIRDATNTVADFSKIAG